jgi:hypothetical protein
MFPWKARTISQDRMGAIMKPDTFLPRCLSDFDGAEYSVNSCEMLRLSNDFVLVVRNTSRGN